jgi:putative restriction endonuclease
MSCAVFAELEAHRPSGRGQKWSRYRRTTYGLTLASHIGYASVGLLQGVTKIKIWVAITDKNWFESVSRLHADEVNFWQPSGSREFRALRPGEPFLFKLHSPDNFIVGGGHFVRYSALPASLAWDAFGAKNGVGSLAELNLRVRRYRREDASLDPVIGCNVLAEPFFLSRPSWIPCPDDWARNIVQGKVYDTAATNGRNLWDAILVSFTGSMVREAAPEGLNDERRFGKEYLTRGRLGQGAFRVMVTDAYARRCAVTGEKTLPVLEAAHIKPYALQGPNRVNNGILLRSDLHKLFDLGYLTVTPELKLEVSPRLKEEWENGREYYSYQGQPLVVQPSDPANRPATEYLSWHNENRFRV